MNEQSKLFKFLFLVLCICISSLVFYIDNFKIANDTMGHTEGDKILKELALNIRMSLRKGDIAARLGGDEFCLLLPNVNEEGTKTISKRIKNKFHNACIKSNWPTTLSIGIINTDKEISLEDLIKKGDILMYKAKLEGKNKIEYFKF